MTHDDYVALVESAHGCEETLPAEVAAMSTFNPWEDARKLAAFRRTDLVDHYGEDAVVETENISSVSEYPI